MYFMRNELRPLQLPFLHRTTNNLLDILWRAHPEATSKSVRKNLRKIAILCEQCRNHCPAAMSFSVVIPPEKVLFNELAMAIIWLEQVEIIHVLDTHTGFQNATISRGKIPTEILIPFDECWASMYAGYSALMRLY